MSGLLSVHDLVVGRRTPLLRVPRLEFRTGESWFVLGRNGGGKTTLLATLLGLLPALGGEIRFAPELADRRRLGYVPQEQRFDPPLPFTVEEFVALGLPDSCRRAEVRAAVAGALAALGAADLAQRQVRELSLGQRRRALVARALVREPRLLLLDEPTANLDGRAAERLGADLERLRAGRGVCVVHVAHDLPLAQHFATHVALVADGEVFAGPAAERFADPRLHAALAGEEP